MCLNRNLIAEVVTRPFENGLTCTVSNVFVQTDDLWMLRNNSFLFKLERHNRTNYLMVCLLSFYFPLSFSEAGARGILIYLNHVNLLFRLKD